MSRKVFEAKKGFLIILILVVLINLVVPLYFYQLIKSETTQTLISLTGIINKRLEANVLNNSNEKKLETEYLEELIEDLIFLFPKFEFGFYSSRSNIFFSTNTNSPDSAGFIEAADTSHSNETDYPHFANILGSDGKTKKGTIYYLNPLSMENQSLGYTFAGIKKSHLFLKALFISFPFNLLFLLLLAFPNLLNFLKNNNISVKSSKHFQEEAKLVLIGQSAASIMHEIRNPFTSIRGFVQILLAKEADSLKKSYLELIIEEVDRVNNLITDFLCFSKPTHPEQKIIPIKKIFDHVESMIACHSLKNQVNITITLTQDDLTAFCDLNQVKQVILNLAQNALQAMEGQENGCLTLKAGAENGYVLIEVSDNGPGIPRQNLSKIFDPFFSTKANGTGLGLSVCKQLIEQQGGQLTVKSEDNIGTTFYINLPYKEKACIPKEDTKKAFIISKPSVCPSPLNHANHANSKD